MEQTTLQKTGPENLDQLLLPLTERIDNLLDSARSAPLIVALDGDAGAGKSTAADFLARKYGGEVVHMDDFFLPENLRTAERLATPGGNVHYERFIDEVLSKLRSPALFSYRIFDCGKMDYCGKRSIDTKKLIVVEGAYSLHPKFSRYYDLACFCTVLPKTQEARILARTGPESLKRFQTRWIPMERRYQESCNVRARCDLVLHLD